MTIQEALEKADRLIPNQIPMKDKIEWLSTLDGQVYRELIQTHEGGEDTQMPAYDGDTDTDTELLVPAPYDEVYIHWLHAKIDLYNLEFTKYTNSSQRYNDAYLTYSDFYTRTHMPLNQAEAFRL